MTSFFFFFTSLPCFLSLSISSSEHEFSGDAGSQEELSLRAPDFGAAADLAAVPGAVPEDQSDGSKGREPHQAHTDPRNSR